MPQLPSGLHFAIVFESLQKLIDQSSQPSAVHHLMAIQKLTDLFPYADVLYFRRSDPSLPAQPPTEGSDALPTGLTPYHSGFNLATIRREAEKWSAEDREKFAAFLDEPRMREYFQEALAVVQDQQKRLLAQPSTPAGLMATWWKLGCHPLQDSPEAPR